MKKLMQNLMKRQFSKVASGRQRAVLLKRLQENNNDPQKAFTGKNSLDKNPIYLDAQNSVLLPDKVKLVWLEDDYTIEKRYYTRFKKLRKL
ncbi:MAG: hypothetical protein WKF71_17455 [Pyrinomonadaceae bacterium]